MFQNELNFPKYFNNLISILLTVSICLECFLDCKVTTLKSLTFCTWHCLWLKLRFNTSYHQPRIHVQISGSTIVNKNSCANISTGVLLVYTTIKPTTPYSLVHSVKCHPSDTRASYCWRWTTFRLCVILQEKPVICVCSLVATIGGRIIIVIIMIIIVIVITILESSSISPQLHMLCLVNVKDIMFKWI